MEDVVAFRSVLVYLVQVPHDVVPRSVGKVFVLLIRCSYAPEWSESHMMNVSLLIDQCKVVSTHC